MIKTEELMAFISMMNQAIKDKPEEPVSGKFVSDDGTVYHYQAIDEKEVKE